MKHQYSILIRLPQTGQPYRAHVHARRLITAVRLALDSAKATRRDIVSVERVA